MNVFGFVSDMAAANMMKYVRTIFVYEHGKSREA